MSEVTKREIDNWIRRMERCYAAIPEGLEAHVGYSSISLYPKGALEASHQEYNSCDVGEAEGCAITGHNLIPYSEGTQMSYLLYSWVAFLFMACDVISEDWA